MNDNLATKLADVHAALSSLEAALEPVLRAQQETDAQARCGQQ